MLKIGTRQSPLALWQAKHIQELLKNSNIDSELVLFETQGDKVLDKSLSKIGTKGLFTAELEDALRTQDIDIAVHSAKDVQSVLPDDLPLLAYPQGESSNDVLVSLNPNFILENSSNIRIGTSSTRRIALFKHYFPDIQLVNIRGNLQTRFARLEENKCDALCLAYAGVERMGLGNFIVKHLDINTFTPPVGQGVIAIQIHSNMPPDTAKAIYNATNYQPTEMCVRAERAFLRELQGGCSVPIFAESMRIKSGDIVIKGGIVSLDGQKIIRVQKSGNFFKPEELGKQLASMLLKQGGDVILKEIKNTLGL